MAFCQTLYLPFLLIPVIHYAYKFITYVVKQIAGGLTADAEKKFRYGLCALLSVSCSFYTYFKIGQQNAWDLKQLLPYFDFHNNVWSNEWFRLANINVQSQAWYVDYTVTMLIAFTALLRFDHFNPLLVVTTAIVDPTLLVLYLFYNLEKEISTNAKPHPEAGVGMSEKNLFYSTLYGLLCSIELYLWVPIAFHWASDHCFIDGLVDTSNFVNSHTVMQIYIMYCALLEYFFHSFLSQNSLFMVCTSLQLCLFLNTSVTVGLFLLYLEFYIVD